MKQLFLIFLLAGCVFLAGKPLRAGEDSFPFQPLTGKTADQQDLFLLQKERFTIGYSFQRRQPLWAGYFLTAENVNSPSFRRPGRFTADPMISVAPVQPKEYTKSGFDRGHMVPAADMAFAMIPLKDSFLMSNIVPQLPGCNRGIWKRLETKVRTYAGNEGEICIITGPVFSEDPAFLKTGAIPIPVAFYKVILDMTPPQKMIAFLVPNAPSRAPLSCFVVTVDAVENLTGLDFFSSLDDEDENAWESCSDFRQWESGSSLPEKKRRQKRGQ